MFVSCHKDPILTQDINGPIKQSEVHKYARHLLLVDKLSHDEELSLARQRALERELAKRARQYFAAQEIAFLKEKIIRPKLIISSCLTNFVEENYAQGILFIKSRAYTYLGQNEKEIRQHLSKIYDSLIKKEISFKELLDREKQDSQFQNIPLAMFPAPMREHLALCDKGKILGPLVIEKTGFLIECDEWQYVPKEKLSQLLSLRSLEETRLILAAEIERLRQKFYMNYRCSASFPTHWERESLLYTSGTFYFSRADFEEFLHIYEIEHQINRRQIKQDKELLFKLFHESCSQKRVISSCAERDTTEFASFVEEKVLARYYGQRVLGQKVLASSQESHSPAHTISEVENNILKEINFRFMTQK